MDRDKYRTFAELRESEVEKRDYRIRVSAVAGSDVVILAPHGGKIEFLTSELARSIAGANHNSYAFEGMKADGNGELHITSSNFDEPEALALVTGCAVVVTVHGLSGDTNEIQIGGRDTALRTRIDSNLRKAGFESRVETSGQFGGTDTSNICNRGTSGAGAQIEIKAGLRRILREDGGRYAAFVNAVREAVAS
ncbi:replication protein [Sphingomonas koreensis]|nr:replication protein [Sphingomonas koreensis]